MLGFSAPNDKGEWSGFDIDFCRAVAAATLGNPDKVKYVPLSTKERFTALQSGEVDLLSPQTTWTLSRDSDLGMSFVGVNYYDGQAFMVRNDLGVKSVKELSGASVCTETGTTTEQNMADYFSSNNIQYQVSAFEKPDQTIQAFNTARCDVYSTDASALYAQRLTLNDPDRFVVLPEVISKEPLGPAVRQGDEQWFKVVRWHIVRDDRGRRTWHHQGERGQDAGKRHGRPEAVPGHRQRSRQGAGPRPDMGLPGDLRRRQLWRGLRRAAWARTVRSRSTAASTSCGARAA